MHKTTLAIHFQNATVGFLQPIEDPITISLAALLFAHNDRQNVSLVCPLLPSLLSSHLGPHLFLTLSVSEHVILLFDPPRPHPRQGEMREAQNYRTLCILAELLKSALMLMAYHV